MKQRNRIVTSIVLLTLGMSFGCTSDDDPPNPLDAAVLDSSADSNNNDAKAPIDSGSNKGGSAGHDGSSDADSRPDVADDANSETGGSGGADADGGSGGTAAGGGSGGTEPDSGPTPSCTNVQLEQFHQQKDKKIEAFVTERLGEPDTDIASIRFAVDDTGTFDLGTNQNRNMKTCQQCLMIVQDPGRPTEKKFIPRSGKITLSSADDPKKGKYTGTLSDVTLEEVTISPTGEPEVVSGGSCLNLQNTAFDTANKCISMKDCAIKEMCDISSFTCQKQQCSNASPLIKCANPKDWCIDSKICRQKCERYGAMSACDNPGETCIMTSSDQTLGFCQKAGRGTVGSKCIYKEAATTGCVDGAVCMNVGTLLEPDYRCVQQCDLFAKKGTCEAGTYCMEGGRCRNEPVLPSGIGEACEGHKQFCGLKDGIAKGVCLNAKDFTNPNNTKCYQWCRTKPGFESDCPSGQKCKGYRSYLGACVPKT